MSKTTELVSPSAIAIWALIAVCYILMADVLVFAQANAIRQGAVTATGFCDYSTS